MFSAARKGLNNNPGAMTFLRGLVDMLGVKGTRDALQKAAPPRSPIQDAMNQQRSIGMGMRELPEIPGQAPKPQFGAGTTMRPQPVEVPMGGTRPVGATPEYTIRRGDPTRMQDVPPAPRTAEPFEVDGQLRIPFTQPGKGGRVYSPLKSAKNPEVAGEMMRSRLGDVLDAADFPRFRGAEGQRAMDLDPM